MSNYLVTMTDPGYSGPMSVTDFEVWPTLTAAKDSLVQRVYRGHWSPPTRIGTDGTKDDSFLPCLSNETELQVYGPFSEPFEGDDDEDVRSLSTVAEEIMGDGYPDRIISLGARGGVKISRV